MKLKGTWRFHDVLKAPSWDSIAQGVRFTTVLAGSAFDSGSYEITCGAMQVNDAVSVDYVITAYTPNDGKLDDALNQFKIFYENGWHDAEYGEGMKTITFTHEQEVSKEFYEWFTENATPVAASIRYNGSIIANLLPGQKATLPCAGMKMSGDVVVRADTGIGQLGNFTATKNGAYDSFYAQESVTWNASTEWDGTATIEGLPIRYKKVANMTVPDRLEDLFALDYRISVSMPEGERMTTPLNQIGLIEANDCYFSETMLFAIVWFKDSTISNELYGTNFDSNAVYITDFLFIYDDSLSDAEITLTAPGKRLDGISSVTVEVIPELQSQSHTITGNGTYTYTPGIAYDGISDFEVTINVQPTLQKKTVTSNGEVLADAGYDGLSQVTVAVESGLAINGIIEQYKVNAGATVNAGDFVEFVNKWSSNNVFDDSSNISAMSACKLGTNSVFLVYRYYSGSTYYYLYGQVLTIEGTEVIIGAKTWLATATNGDYYLKATSAVALTDSKVFIIYQSISSGTRLYGQVLTINGTTITAGTATSLIVNTNSTYGDRGYTTISAVALSDSKVFIVYPHAESNIYLYGQVITIDDTAITAGTATSLSYIAASYYDKCFKAISAVALTDSKVFVAYQYYSTNFSESWLCGNVCTIDGTAITVGTETKLRFVSGDNSYRSISATALTGNKVFLAYRYYASSVHYYAGTVCAVEGATITKGTEIALSSSSTGNAISAVALTDSKAFVAYHYFSTVCTIDGTAITVGTETALDDARISTVGNAALAFSDSSVLVVSSGSENTFIGATINGTGITVNSELESAGTYVQPATSRLHNVGVASTGGSEGETVDVYVVR